MLPIHILQGMRYFFSSLNQKIKGPKRYQGNADEICRQIVKNCWNGLYFQTSTHHYREFWARDFGYCAESLVKLGYLDEVRQTLAYALEKFSKTGIKTTISREGIPFSFPNLYSPDSVALLLHALRIAKDKGLIKKYNTFLQREIDAFGLIVLEDGKVRNTQFSGMRDYAVRNSSCYDHCMSILLAREAKKLGFKFDYSEKQLVNTLNNYWIGYYRDDMASLAPSGDANVLPFWLGVGKDFNKVLSILHDELPLSYGTKQKMIAEEIFVPGWETGAVWPLLGFIWMKVVKNYNPALAKKYKANYSAIIEKYGTLYEVYLNNKPYKSFFYHADEGMLWAANFLTL